MKTSFIKRHIALWIVILLSICLRIPSLFEPYWHGDEGITLTVGNAVKNGALLYRDISDNKPPFLYLVAAIFNTLFLFKLASIVVTVSCVSVFYVLKRYFNQNKHVFSLFLFTVLISTPLIESTIINGELYMLLPVLISFILFFKSKYVLSGIFSGVAVLFKQPSAFEFGALLLFSCFYFKQEDYKKIVGLIIGFLIPTFLVWFYYVLNDSGAIFWNGVYIDNLRYSESWRLYINPKTLLGIKLLVVTILTFFLFLIRKNFNNSRWFVMLSIWFLFALFGASFSNRPYPHYLIQIAAPFSLLAGLVFIKKINPFIKKISIGLIFLLLFMLIFQFKINKGWVFYTFSYYSQFWKQEFFGDEVEVTNRVLDKLNLYAKTADKIFVWSDNSLIYAKSKRIPPVKYISAYHISGNEDRESELMLQLKQKPPQFVIVTKPIKHSFPALFAFLSVQYNQVEDTDEFSMYEINKK
jgi:4-amino-4-deoxy-L-arabinose transferase-like glycosyltransferase